MTVKEWVQAIREIGSLALLFFVLWKAVPALNRMTNAIYWIAGKFGFEPDEIESAPARPRMKREHSG